MSKQLQADDKTREGHERLIVWPEATCTGFDLPGGGSVSNKADEILRRELGLDLRAALAQPDPAAQARATLEQAVRDEVISGFSESAVTNEHETWYTVYLKRRGEDGVSRSYWTSERSVGSNLRAMQCAAAHTESLRKPKVADPEEMTAQQCCEEMKALGYMLQLAVPTMKYNAPFGLLDIREECDEVPSDFHRRALREARAAQQ